MEEGSRSFLKVIEGSMQCCNVLKYSRKLLPVRRMSVMWNQWNSPMENCNSQFQRPYTEKILTSLQFYEFCNQHGTCVKYVFVVAAQVQKKFDFNKRFEECCAFLKLQKGISLFPNGSIMDVMSYRRSSFIDYKHILTQLGYFPWNL